jgi:hypothetical protein
MTDTPSVPIGSIWRHVKRDRCYKVEGKCMIEGALAVLYRSTIEEPIPRSWCLYTEFIDGRFEKMTDHEAGT